MKLFLIDNTKRIKEVKKELEKEFVIEEKNDMNFKMTKNDFVITSDQEKNLRELENLKNIILIVDEKDEQHIWNLANNFKTVDIISGNEGKHYITSRIKNDIK